MSLRSFINVRFVKPLRALPFQLYYLCRKSYERLNDEKRDHHIVVSLTSFPARFDSLHFSIKSILTQTMKPDVIFLCLTKEEVKNESELPLSILELKKYGLKIFFADDNLKPHNKYLSAMKLYPDSLIVTVDDDGMYSKDLVFSLYASYLRNPACVSARRVHKITVDESNNVLPYIKWCNGNIKITHPSHELLATGVGGVLYPPNILPAETFDTAKIKELCLNADDIWLKFMELKYNVPVVWVKNRRVHPLTVVKTQKITLQQDNVHGNNNDRYVDNMQKYCKINLASFLGN